MACGSALLVAGLAAAVVGGVPAAAGSRPYASASRSFVDPAGDGGGAPDITGVTISNDDRGFITVAVTLANRSRLLDGDSVSVRFDSDLDPSTGCVGDEDIPRADYRVFANGHGADPTAFGRTRCVDGVEDATTPDASLTYTPLDATQTMTFRVNRADIGNPDALTVWVWAAFNPTPTAIDLAPDTGPMGFELAINPTLTQTSTVSTTVTSTQLQTTTSVPAPDRIRPVVHVFGASGRRGGVIHLRYRATDNNGATREEIRLYGRAPLGVKRRRLSVTAPGVVEMVNWVVPNGAAGPFRFCVRAWDAAGNASERRCAPVQVR